MRQLNGEKNSPGQIAEKQAMPIPRDAASVVHCVKKCIIKYSYKKNVMIRS